MEHQYEMAGKLRLSVLHVLKLRHSGDNGWRNNYFIFAENRPLLALHQVLHDKMVVVTIEQLCCNSIKNMCAVRQATSVVQVALEKNTLCKESNVDKLDHPSDESSWPPCTRSVQKSVSTVSKVPLPNVFISSFPDQYLLE